MGLCPPSPAPPPGPLQIVSSLASAASPLMIFPRQAPAFVAMSFHREKLTTSSPGLAVLGRGAKPGRGGDGNDEPEGFGSLVASCNPGERGPSHCLGTEAERGPPGWVVAQVGRRAIPKHGSQREWPLGSSGKGNSKKTLPRVPRLPGRLHLASGSCWVGPALSKNRPGVSRRQSLRVQGLCPHTVCDLRGFLCQLCIPPGCL